jgi:GTP-binding protein
VTGVQTCALPIYGLNTLIDYRYQQHFRAARGGHGMGRQRTGADAEPVTLRVPRGTQVLDEDNETLLADLTEIGQRVRLCKGGDGGFGNEHYKSSTNRAPRRGDPGWPGEEKWIWLRLKLIADAGLVGLPNAGKSTFLARTSRAKPKIADYPFTTLKPQLGVVNVDDKEFVLADLPGLIEGASEGAGLGTRFLGHVERCAVILHLIDATEPEPVKNWRLIRKELTQYGAGLEDKPEVIGLNKIDAVPPDELKAKIQKLKRAAKRPVLTLSGVTGEGVEAVTRALFEAVAEARAIEAAEKQSRIELDAGGAA